MIETIEISNCNAHIVGKINPELLGTRRAIENNSLKLYCRKMDEQVNINTSALFGRILGFACMNLDCPLRKPNETQAEPPDESEV